MATIDIGKLAFTHKGDYAGGTAYVANDVVYYNGSAYIAKQSTTGNLPTDTNNWNTFTAGSGGIWNSGLSIGSAGQVVKVNSGASALEFGTVSSDYVKLATATANGSSQSINLDGFFTSDYDYYEIIATDVFSSTNSTMRGRVIVSGSAISSSSYDWGFTVPYRNSGATALDTVGAWKDTDFRINYNGQGTSINDHTSIHLKIFSPLSSGRQYIDFQSRGSTGVNNEIGTTYGGARLENAGAISGIQLLTASGNLTGTFKLYGVK